MPSNSHSAEKIARPDPIQNGPEEWVSPSGKLPMIAGTAHISTKAPILLLAAAWSCACPRHAGVYYWGTRAGVPPRRRCHHTQIRVPGQKCADQVNAQRPPSSRACVSPGHRVARHTRSNHACSLRSTHRAFAASHRTLELTMHSVSSRWRFRDECGPMMPRQSRVPPAMPREQRRLERSAARPERDRPAPGPGLGVDSQRELTTKHQPSPVLISSARLPALA